MGWKVPLETALDKVAEYLGIVPQQLQSRCRSHDLSRGRVVTVQAWAAVGRPIAEIAPILGISHQAASYLLQRPVDACPIQQLVKPLL